MNLSILTEMLKCQMAACAATLELIDSEINQGNPRLQLEKLAQAETHRPRRATAVRPTPAPELELAVEPVTETTPDDRIFNGGPPHREEYPPASRPIGISSPDAVLERFTG